MLLSDKLGSAINSMSLSRLDMALEVVYWLQKASMKEVKALADFIEKLS